MNRRELAKNGFLSLFAALLGKKFATEPDTATPTEPVNWDALECIVAVPLPAHGYGDTVWLNVYRPPDGNDLSEYYYHMSLGLPTVQDGTEIEHG